MLFYMDKFLLSVSRLQDAINQYLSRPDNAIIRDGMIHRFEFALSLSWKAAKDYLIHSDISCNTDFPKQVIKTAYTYHLIDDEKIWMDMLDSTKYTSHTFDDSILSDLAADISIHFFPALNRLADRFRFSG